jgi:hypothetical protein
MTTLYNCHSDGLDYRITKFEDGNPTSSYLCSTEACECPAGVRPTCRHRQMLPAFLEYNLVNSNLFLDWDNGRRIVDFDGQPATVQSNEPLEPTDIRSPGDLYTEKDFMTDMFVKDITPIPDLAPQALTDTIDRTLIEHKPEDSFREHLHKEGKVPRHLHPQEVHTDKNPWRRF